MCSAERTGAEESEGAAGSRVMTSRADVGAAVCCGFAVGTFSTTVTGVSTVRYSSLLFMIAPIPPRTRITAAMIKPFFFIFLTRS